VNESVGCVLQVELSTGRPDVALVVEVGLYVSMLSREESVSSDIKLSVLVQKGFFDVLLDDIRSLFPVDICIFAEVLDVVKVFRHLNSCSLVSVFSWLNDPVALA